MDECSYKVVKREERKGDNGRDKREARSCTEVTQGITVHLLTVGLMG